MIMAERRERIVEFINKEGNITFAQLKQEFPDVSEMTLRTDLFTPSTRSAQIISVHRCQVGGLAVGTDDLLARQGGA